MKKKIELIEYDFQGDLFIDIGGNIGLWSKELYYDYKKIFFLEPSQEAIELAKININDQLNKVVYYKNICSNESKLKKTIYSSTGNSVNYSIFAKDLYSTVISKEEDIETITIDDLLESASEHKDILIKIDTEGCDLDIILGGMKFIKEKKPNIIMEAHFHMYYDDEKFNTIKNFLYNLGYKMSEYKNDNYLHSPYHIFDGKHNGLQMHNLHYQILFSTK